MGFNFGAFAGGAAQGIQAGSNLADQMQQRQLRQAQLNSFNNNNLGEQAYYSSQIPGATPVPEGMHQGQGGIVPILSQMPVVGQIGRELGLWGPMPTSPQAAQPYAGGQGASQGGGMAPPPMQGAPQPFASQGAPMGQPAPRPQGQAPVSGGTPMAAVAEAIDRANPGLRTTNPQAFAAAVKIGVQHLQESEKMSLERDLTRAQTSNIGSQADVNRAQVADMQGPGADLKRAQIGNIQSETSLRGEQIKAIGPEIKLKEAQQKLEELKADNAQVQMRLEEAKLNAQVGDYASQREYRDAQIAQMRAQRLLNMQEQKLKDIKTRAEVDELKARSSLHESKASGSGVVNKDKQINGEITKAAVQLRHYEDMERQLLQSINPNEPRIKALLAETRPFIQAYRARVQDLEGQLSTAKPPAAPTPSAEIPAPRQQELDKISSKFLELQGKSDKEGVQRLITLMSSKGVPAHEIQWAIENARNKMSAPTTSQVQVPQSR
jgi:BMFP domain-containing protein YqiC